MRRPPLTRTLLHPFRVLQARLRERKKSHARSPQWDNVRDAFLVFHMACAACGSSKEVQVHHIMPFHLHPELELDPANLIGLCMSRWNCHLFIGHGGVFGSWNPTVREDAAFVLVNPGNRKYIETLARTRRKQ